ncbi:MAG: hypothetical protein OEZ34_08790, partial [Spirochaetia bacterium]|nr:hypothetical protein [Spirochaetia bacterium]
MSADAIESPGNVIIHEKIDRVALTRWAQAGTENGNHLWMQINHPGRQIGNYLQETPVAPTGGIAVNIGGMFNPPRELSEQEIESIIDSWVRSALIAKECGFTGVQIHSAHGYLSSQFLSPLTNQRTDRWGGSVENRARFLLEIVRKTREAAEADFPIGVKLNSADFQRGGFDEKDSLTVIQLLEQEKIDLLEISGGTYERPSMIDGRKIKRPGKNKAIKKSTAEREAYFLEFAEHVRKSVSLPLMVTGGFRSKDAMETALRDGSVDVIGMGRPFGVCPDLPNQFLNGTLDSVHADPPREFPVQIMAGAANLK